MVASGRLFWPHATFPSLQGRRSQWKDGKSGVWFGGQPHLLPQIKPRTISTVKETDSLKLTQVIISPSLAYLFATLWTHRPVYKIRSVTQHDTIDTTAKSEKPMAAWLWLSIINCKNSLVFLPACNELIQLWITRKTICNLNSYAVSCTRINLHLSGIFLLVYPGITWQSHLNFFCSNWTYGY